MTIRKTAIPMLFVLLFSLACASSRNNDGNIERHVRESIASSMSGKVYVTTVVVNNGVVTLTGTARSEEDRRAIGNAADKAEGVRSVINNVVVEPAP